MNQQQRPETEFAQRLRAELTAIVAERGAAQLPTSAATGAPAWRRRGPRLSLAFAGATAAAAVVAGVLVLSSGPTAQTAAAEVLRQTAAVAAAADGPTGNPGPGQFLYTKTESMELQGWAPGSFTIGGGLLNKSGAFHALVRKDEEEWRNENGETRTRWVLGGLNFLSGAEKGRWEAAGSPLPESFDPSDQHNTRAFGEHVNELRRGVVDTEATGSPGFTDFSKLPTEPKALRLALEYRQVPGYPNYQGPAPLSSAAVISELWDILDKPNTTPALRAALFGALAEEPGIELNRNAEDLVGRSGYGLSFEVSKSGDSYGASIRPGIKVEYIFDPTSSAILGSREFFTHPEEIPTDEEAIGGVESLPAGTVRREIAYLRSGVVDSTHERPGEIAPGRSAS